MRNPLKPTAAALFVVFLAAACSSGGSSEKSSADKAAESTTTSVPASAGTIVDVASANSDFSTLVTAVDKAGLVETLSGPGPFTVFAPTNDAFAKIPSDQFDAILADQAQLTAILTYHVIPSKVMSTDLQPTQSVATVQGGNVDIEVSGGAATINGCNIVTTDVEASNGVIHVIDCVLTPPA